MLPSAYRVLNIKDTNEILKSKGISDGGQLAALNPKLIAKDLNVQALMYGMVEHFGYVNVGFYAERKVALTLQLVNGTTGEKMWENTQTGATRKFTLDAKEAQDNFVGGIASQMVDKTMKMPLENESNLATISTLKKLPGFYFSGFAPDTAHAVFIDRDLSTCRRNLFSLALEKSATLIVGDCLKPPKASRGCDLVFLDPPYKAGVAAQAISALVTAGWIADGSIVVIEMDAKAEFTPPAKFKRMDDRRYGAARVAVLLYEPGTAPAA